jgi:hypothetical protein
MEGKGAEQKKLFPNKKQRGGGTHRIPGMVMEVSATFVATTILRTPEGGVESTLS